MASKNRRKHARYVEHIEESGPVIKVKPVAPFNADQVQHHEKWCMSWYLDSAGQAYACNCYAGGPEPEGQTPPPHKGGE